MLHRSRPTYALHGKAFLVPLVVALAITCMIACGASDTGWKSESRLGLLKTHIAELTPPMVERAEAIRAVKRLQVAYGHYAEFGLWNDLADLFAEDGIGHYPVGDLKKEEIRKLFLKDIGGGKLGLPEGLLYPHIMLQPVVSLSPDGKSAKGRWRVFTMLGFHGKNANWAGGVYENEYVKQDGIWHFQSMHIYPILRADYDKGWAKSAKPAKGINEEYPPDRPSTAAYEIFPKFYVPKFHYDNPVTGLSPQYPEETTPGGLFSGSMAVASFGAGVNPDDVTATDMEKIAEEVKRGRQLGHWRQGSYQGV